MLQLNPNRRIGKAELQIIAMPRQNMTIRDIRVTAKADSAFDSRRGDLREQSEAVEMCLGSQALDRSLPLTSWLWNRAVEKAGGMWKKRKKPYATK
jgi:hypothetical protein